ncbi:MAG TPA: VTT domain-containing protein [Bryobacteraceae bacterium]|nr:VTT domain-containing protein [Bryobacteraceae bacterium]
MAEILAWLQTHGYATVFAAVFIEQMGAPVPAVPVLLAAGAFAGLGHFSFAATLAAAFTAALLSDWLWFELGRRRGQSALQFLCRFSLEPDTCVTLTTHSFERHGPLTLLFAKFIPGLSTVAPPLAGISRMSLARFLAFDAAGALLWAAAGLGAGFLFRNQLERATLLLSQFGGWMTAALAAALAAYIALKFFRRRQTQLQTLTRITPAELRAHLDSGEPVTIVDLRSAVQVQRSGRKIPGALVMHPADAELHLRSTPRGHHLVFYCT